MLKSYFKVALRSFRRNKLVTFINIFGLGLAMTIGMIVLIRMQFQLGFDNFHPAPQKTYRITSEFLKKSGERWKMATTSLPLRQYIEENSRDVRKVSSIYPAIHSKAIVAGKELYLNAAFTEPAFFDIFGFQFKAGSPASALSQPHTIVLSDANATRYFGAEDPINKTIRLENGELFTVTGVLQELPGKSQLSYDAYISASTVMQMENSQKLPSKSTDWFAFNSAYTFVLMEDEGGPIALKRALEGLSANLNKTNTEGELSFKIQALSEINPSWEELSNEMPGVSSWMKIIVEMSVALLILAAACFNYTNLTIARALTRAKEVGVRKINGAGRKDVFVQYVVEAIALSLLALTFAWFILIFIVRFAPFNDGYEFIPSTFRYDISYVVKTIGFALFAGLFAGFAPAWILSSFTPLRVLKSLSTAKIGGRIGLQKTLVVFQYSLSLIIVIFLLTFYKQFSFMSAAKSGYQTNDIVVVPLNGVNSELAKQQISKVAGIQKVGSMSGELSKRFNGLTTVVWLREPQDAIRLNYYFADADFIQLMGFEFKAGEVYADRQSFEKEPVIINEEAANHLGFKNYTDAVGQTVWLNDSTSWQIAGVINNFSYENVGLPVKPMAFRTAPDANKFAYAIVDGSVNRTLLPKTISSSMQSLSHGYQLTPTWLDEDIELSYSQSATISLLGYLAFMATAIASLGLLGLVIHNIQTRRKEISIRKIIGASERQLVVLLSQRFIKLLFISGFIAVPIGYILSHLFLRNFVVRMQDTMFWPIICFLFLLGLGLFAIISQTYKAAIANPGKDLRTE